ncbi:hypothetical protein [Stenotrophomonas sp.]|uniref:hypothetical protein n=1 Tax=Stenotrophomonas sp. TaxID=69392 RepID=UPI0028AF4AD0|nr:hypothetical protein [Stenotrophomonas sp.]
MTHTDMPLPARLLLLVLDDDLDGALAAGLMDYVPGPADASLLPGHPELPARLLQAQQQLQRAWDARARYRQRAQRLARRAAERDARRAPPAPTPELKPALPPAAAAILARAKAKAAGKLP